MSLVGYKNKRRERSAMPENDKRCLNRLKDCMNEAPFMLDSFVRKAFTRDEILDQS